MNDRSTPLSNGKAWTAARVAIAVAAGWLATAGTLLSINVEIAPFRVSFTWSLFLPVLVALAWGSRYALVAVTAGLVWLFPFLLWPNNGWGSAVNAVTYSLWIVWHGYCADKRRSRPALTNNPYVAQAAYSVVYAAVTSTLFPLSFKLNPTFWPLDAAPSIPADVVVAIVVKGVLIQFLVVAFCDTLAALPGVRRALGLPVGRTARYTWFIVATATVAGIALCMMDAMVEGYLFSQTFTLSALWRATPQDVVRRVFLFITCAATGSVIARFVERRLVVEEQLEESSQRYATLFRSIAQGILCVAPDGRITSANPAAEQLLGMPLHDLVHRSLHDACWDTVREDGTPLPAAEHPASVAARTRTLVSEFLVGMTHQADGARRWLLVDAVPQAASHSAGAPHVYAVLTDITRHRRHEHERRTLQEQLFQSQKLEATGLLAGSIAHDLNNLLSIMLGYADMLIRLPGTAGSEVFECASAIADASRKAAHMTRQLLAFARRQVFELRVVCLNDVVTGFRPMFDGLTGENIRLVLRLAEDAGLVKADVSQMEQVLLNLAANARDAMPAGGDLIIETANAVIDADYAGTHPGVAPGEYVRLSVTDTGRGIDEETLKRVFDPFFTTKNRGEGTGLGLSTVYGIVTQHGGSISVSSEPGRGTSFTILFPRVHEQKTTANTGTAADASPFTGLTVLVVEDEPAVRKLCCSMLSTMGCTVVQAQNGEEALALARSTPGLRLLLTDVVMPGMNGSELYDCLVREYPALKVVFMSGYSREVIGKHGVTEARHLQKPFTAGELQARIREAIGP